LTVSFRISQVKRLASKESPNQHFPFRWTACAFFNGPAVRGERIPYGAGNTVSCKRCAGCGALREQSGETCVPHFRILCGRESVAEPAVGAKFKQGQKLMHLAEAQRQSNAAARGMRCRPRSGGGRPRAALHISREGQGSVRNRSSNCGWSEGCAFERGELECSARSRRLQPFLQGKQKAEPNSEPELGDTKVSSRFSQARGKSFPARKTCSRSSTGFEVLK